MSGTLKIETLLSHAGLRADDPTGAISTPIYQTATFRHPELGKSTGFDYTRSGNPTRKALEEAMALLEAGHRAFAFSSGMAALTSIALLFKAGDHLIVSDDLYGGTYRLFEKVFSPFGIQTTYADMTSLDNLQKALTPTTKAVLIETPTNPLMKITDIKAVSTWANANYLLSIVDNTFMTPYLQRPLELGADIVVHSGTKYLGGHNDVVAGIAVTKSPELSERLYFIQNAAGAVLSPNDSWLVLRGLKTLAVRIDRAQDNAEKLVRFLKSHPAVSEVLYPSLPEHPGKSIHFQQASGAGAMVSFKLKNKEQVAKIINSVRVISYAESLGGVESLITYPVIQTHADIPAELRLKIGLTDDLLRLSVGIENPADLIEDLSQALS